MAAAGCSTVGLIDDHYRWGSAAVASNAARDGGSGSSEGWSAVVEGGESDLSSLLRRWSFRDSPAALWVASGAAVDGCWRGVRWFCYRGGGRGGCERLRERDEEEDERNKGWVRERIDFSVSLFNFRH